MKINWFFYNFSSSTPGLHTPINDKIDSVLDETESEIDTIASMSPKLLSSKPINSYQWLPIVGGGDYSGCYLFSECFVNKKWIRNENGVIKLDDIKNVKNTGVEMTELIDKLLLLKEWQNFGVFSFRVQLYIPEGKSADQFFFGLVKSDQ